MTSQDNTPLLSICIPTYNRSSYLHDALESIAQQLTDKHLAEQVEVIVSDNASTDDTETVARSFTNKINHLTYYKNEANLGFDLNVDNAVRHASGTYCWYLGDDDIIVNGALAHMLTQCAKNTYAIISTTSQEITERDSKVFLQKITYTDADMFTSSDPNESYTQNYYPSALSLLAFRRDAWLNAADIQNHTPGWYYFETILRLAIAATDPTLHIKKPMVLTGQDCRWADNGQGMQIFIDCNIFLRKMIDWGYNQTRTEQELSGNARQFPLVLLQAKARGLPVTWENFRLMRSYTRHIPWHLRSIGDMLFCIPNIFIKIIRDLKKSIT